MAETKTAKHTPTPWKSDGIHIQGPIRIHTCADGSTVEYRNSFALDCRWGSLEQRRIDAELIVRAVNSYAVFEELVRALERCLENKFEGDKIFMIATDALRSAREVKR